MSAENNLENDDLISTDIDRLIRTISQKKKISLNDLRNISKTDKKILDRWLVVLEEEGLINIEYGFMGTTVLWIGPNDDSDDDDDSDEESSDRGSDLEIKKPIVSAEPEEAFQKNIKQKARSYMKSEPTPELIRETPSIEESDIVSDFKKLGKTNRNSTNTNLVEEKKKLQDLSIERENLYSQKILSTESTIKADLAALTQLISEKQEKIEQIKKGLNGLPEKYSTLKKSQQQIDEIREKSKESLKKTKESVDSFIGTLGSTKKIITNKVSELSETLESEHSKLQNLEKVGQTVEQKLQKISSSEKQLREQMAELNKSMTSLMSELEEVTEMKGEVDSLKDELKNTAQEHSTALEGLKSELESIMSVEDSLLEYVNDYENKIEEIEKYVLKSDEEISKLTTAAEEIYIKKSIDQLENLKKQYGKELDDALKYDSELEKKINESKKNISEMLSDSEDAAKELSENVGDSDFESIKDKNLDSSEEISQMIKQKNSQGSRILEKMRKKGRKK